MVHEVKQMLEPRAYEKLREVIKTKTNFDNLNEENIKVTKEAVNILLTWLEGIYNLDRKEIINDEDGIDIEKLFKTTAG